MADDELVARLREDAERERAYVEYVQKPENREGWFDTVSDEMLREHADCAARYALAADRITALDAEVQRMREALRPFAEAACVVSDWPDEDGIIGKATVGDLRRARAAMGERDG